MPTACVSVRVPFFFFLSAIRADLRQHGAGSGRHVRNRVDSRRFGPNQSVSASTTDTGAELANSGRNSKKKKVAKRTVWEKITKPYLYLSSHFSPIHSLILIFSSLSLSVSGLCAPWLSASGLCSPSVCLPSLTQSHSHTHTSQSHSQLTHNLTDPVTHSQVSTQLSQLKSQVLTHSQVSTHSQPHRPGDTLSLSSCFSYYLLLLLNLVYVYIM